MASADRKEPQLLRSIASQAQRRFSDDEKRRAASAVETFFKSEVERGIRENISSIGSRFRPPADVPRRSLFNIIKQTHDSLEKYCCGCIAFNPRLRADFLIDGILRSERDFSFGELVIVDLDKALIEEDLKAMLERYSLSHSASGNQFIEDFISDLEQSLPIIKQIAMIAAKSTQGNYSTAIRVAEKIQISEHGAVRFVVRDNRLSPEKPLELVTAFEEHLFIATVLADFEYKHFISRIHNQDKYLGELVDGYSSAFLDDAPARDLKLYFSGLKLRDYISRISDGTRFEVDLEVLTELRALLVIHESYIWRFQRISSSANNQQNTLQTYGDKFTDIRSSQQELARKFSRQHGLFDNEAISVMQEASSRDESVVTKVGADGILNNIINGALRGAANIIVMSRYSAIAIALGVTSNAATVALAETDLYKQAVVLIKSNHDLLLKLSRDLPHDFSWLHDLLSLVTKN